MASEKFERAKEQAMAGYLDPGPNHLNCAQTIIRCALLAMDQDPDVLRRHDVDDPAWSRGPGELPGASALWGVCP